MRRYVCLRGFLAALIVCQSLVVPSVATADPIFGRLKRFVHEAHYQGTEPPTCEVGAIEELAENIDWLEHHIDRYGSIVAKQPDIWGEARLTKHRDEYERVLFPQLNQFRSTLNAAITQEDAAFLAQALALSAAASGETPPALSIQPSSAGAAVRADNVAALLQNTSVAPENGNFQQFRLTTPDATQTGVQLEPTLHLDQLSRYVNHLHELRRINEGDDTSDSPGYSMNLVRVPVSVLPGKLTRTGYGAEVTLTATPFLSDDLLPTTFRNLVVNDLVDMTGLPLVRVTEYLNTQAGLDFLRQRAVLKASVQLLKNALEVGRAASRSAASTPAGQREVQVLSAIERDMTRLLQDEAARRALIVTVEELLDLATATNTTNLRRAYEAMTGQSAPVTPVSEDKLAQIQFEWRRIVRSKAARVSQNEMQNLTELRNHMVAYDADTTNTTSLTNALDTTARMTAEGQLSLEQVALVTIDVLRGLTTDACKRATIAPTGRSRRALNPLPPSTLVDTLGLDGLTTVSGDFFSPAYNGRYVRWNGAVVGGEPCCTTERRVDLLDARRFLEAEFNAAYDLLSRKEYVGLFSSLAHPDSGLATAIRNQNISDLGERGCPTVEEYRDYFFESLAGLRCADDDCPHATDTAAFPYHVQRALPTDASSSVESLAWMVVVESALLNDRLNDDVRKLARAQGTPDLNVGRDLHFYLPDTVADESAGLVELRGEFDEATRVFERYVEVRWPIHVFAIDPREQDQNVADVSARRRELQFAMALGFVTGQVGANSLTQFARTQETNIETISLNRTIVGFGHGDNTFGWRIQPRVQALDVPGLFGSLRETICGASRDYDLKRRKLEPGKRECTALVLMPSFVPYCDFDVRTNWYKLTNPKNAVHTMKDTIRMSRAISAMKRSRAQCSRCAHLYREGEVQRLMRRVDQLDKELPLQSMRALVPYENTLGGFEMFNTGVTDLSPELLGFYGAPGVIIGGDACGCDRGCQLNNGNCADDDQCTEIEGRVETLETQVGELMENGASPAPASPLPACEGVGTTLFLVGDNFSVHDTKVIAGGVCIPHVRLISRELMQVTIPNCVHRVTLCENGVDREYVAVYVSTPYGVTNHLHIPAWNETDDPPGVDGRPPTAMCPTPAAPVREPIPFMAPAPPTAPAAVPSIDDLPPLPEPVGAAANVGWESVGSEIRLVQENQDADPDPVAEELADINKNLDTLARNQLGSLPLQTQSPDVIVNMPETVQRDRPDDRDHPLLHRTSVRLKECWRNVRDQLPGN